MFKKLFESLKHRQLPLPLLFILAVGLYGCLQQDLNANNVPVRNSVNFVQDAGIVKSEIVIDDITYDTYIFPLKSLGINSTDKCVMLRNKYSSNGGLLHCGNYW